MARVHIAVIVTSAVALRVPLRRTHQYNVRRIRAPPLRNDYLESISPEPPAVQKPKALDENSISGDTFLGALTNLQDRTRSEGRCSAFAGVGHRRQV